MMEAKDFAATVGAGSDAVHQGLALMVAPLEPVFLDEVLRGDQPLLVLDQVTDPHNLGAMLRSAAAFNAAAVILTKDHSAPETAVVAKAASGGLDIVPRVVVTNLASALREIKEAGYWVAGLSGDAKQTIREAKLNRKTALVLGAEGKGLRRLTAESCDVLVRLPMSERMESLNVSNAAAIALYSVFAG
jgi:23S rRNA (guanosine2251-2'-O)-methyltransferase